MSDDGLVAFLRARLDEDEAVALAVADMPGGRPGRVWAADLYFERSDERYWSIKTVTPGHLETVELAGAGRVGGGVHTGEAAEHIARHDPARVLAEVKAKRRIVDQIVISQTTGVYDGTPFTMDPGPAELVLRELASPYADHPDYRPDWSPGV